MTSGDGENNIIRPRRNGGSKVVRLRLEHITKSKDQVKKGGNVARSKAHRAKDEDPPDLRLKWTRVSTKKNGYKKLRTNKIVKR